MWKIPGETLRKGLACAAFTVAATTAAAGSTQLPFGTVATLKGHTKPVTVAAWSPDGARIVTGAVDKTVRIWDAKTGMVLFVLRGHGGTIASAAFSPDGRRILTVSYDTTARIWDTATGTPLAVLNAKDPLPAPWNTKTVLFDDPASPDGRRTIPHPPGNTAIIRDTGSGATIAVLQGHSGPVTTAVFSPDGTRVLTTSADKTARLWDAVTGEALAVLGGNAIAYGPSFAPDGRHFLTNRAETKIGKEKSVYAMTAVKTASLYDAADGTAVATLVRTVRYPGKRVTGVVSFETGSQQFGLVPVWSPDGTRLLIDGDTPDLRIMGFGGPFEAVILPEDLGSRDCARFRPPKLKSNRHTTVTFLVTAGGTVESPQVLKSSRSKKLDLAAVRCAAQWRYRPARDAAGMPVPIRWKADVNW